jgi:hypothetical protein
MGILKNQVEMRGEKENKKVFRFTQNADEIPMSRILMKRRREHAECDAHLGGRGCLVFGSPVCTERRRKSNTRRWKVWLRFMAALGWFFGLALLVGVLGMVFERMGIRGNVV